MKQETIDIIRRTATLDLDQSTRSSLGQYLTPSNIAAFMAGLFAQKNFKEINLLDAGAGIGSLAAAFLNNQIEQKCSSSISVTAFEIDRILVKYLKSNLSTYEDICIKHGITLNSQVINDDFIDAAVEAIRRQSLPNLFDENQPKLVFTHAILNPPYKKINSQSRHRKSMSSIGFETVNLYSAFVGLSLMLLQDKGELVAIIPRSFCNGNYYKNFRKLINIEAAIKKIHLFDSRTKAFKDDAVLQENIIIHLVKGVEQTNVIISHSTDDTFNDINEQAYAYHQIVKPNDVESFIHVPGLIENPLEHSETVTFNLQDIGVQVSTGPVVDFRAKDELLSDPIDGSVPLFYPTHFNGKENDWPKVGKKPNSIKLNSKTEKMLFPNGFYTVVRRFSSKEEKQRIVARVINPRSLPFKMIGIENHLNVFHFQKKGIDENLAYGLAAFLNSTFVDTCFRSFNGHTQVNATDLKQIKYPSREKLIKLGLKAKKMKSFDPVEIDKKVRVLI